MVEPIREHTYSLSAYLDATKEEDIREDQDVQRLSGQWDTSMINELVYTVLTRDYILPIIIGEEDLEGGMTQLWLVDGVQRTSSFILFRFGNHKITSSISEAHKTVDYQVRAINEDGDFIKDEEGNFVYETKTCNLVGKTFETLPKELQKEFDRFQIKTVIHQHCTMEKISELVRRYNNHKAMNAAQTAFTYVDKFARRIRNITEHKFFTECDGFSEKEKRSGVYERVVCETAMTMFHLDDWQKQSKKMGMYLNEHATDNEFDIVNRTLDKAFDMGLASYDQIFTAKDAFIWFALFQKFNNIEPSSDKFTTFLDAFVNELHSKVVDGVSFDEINTNRATKDKAVIKRKLVLLEKLMRDFLHIEEVEKENHEAAPEQFIAENVGLNIESVRNDMDFYNQMLDDLEDRTIKDGSKLLNPDNRLSLLALVAYSIEMEIDLDDWMLEYARDNNTYFMDQRKNFLHMKQDFEKYLKKKVVAA
ncbi:hypothetical protein [Enterocloster bolteae]|uniref:hypothetical protein n=1 Tax=Enterocloster bolteae TaxID=208479 RepID=UPI0034A4A52B